MNELIHGGMSDWTCEWMNEKHGWMYVCIKVRINEVMHEALYVYMNECICMNDCTYEGIKYIDAWMYDR